VRVCFVGMCHVCAQVHVLIELHKRMAGHVRALVTANSDVLVPSQVAYMYAQIQIHTTRYGVQLSCEAAHMRKCTWRNEHGLSLLSRIQSNVIGAWGMCT
jgi:hypothetical protein